MNIALSSLSSAQLKRAVVIKEKLESLDKELVSILGATASTPAKPAKRKMSAAGRARIVAAAKARWAKVKGTKASAKPAKKVRRKMSAAARAKIAASAKARWAKAKAQGKKTL